jgi:hypothetical protein
MRRVDLSARRGPEHWQYAHFENHAVLEG